jgi:hypothetical protein
MRLRRRLEDDARRDPAPRSQPRRAWNVADDDSIAEVERAGMLAW